MTSTPIELTIATAQRLSVPARTTRPPRQLTESELATLLRIADTLVPACGPNPAASEARDYRRYLDLALAARADVFEAVCGVLADLADVRDADLWDALKRLWADDKSVFDPLSAIVAGAYFMTPQVKALIGYPGQHRDPPGFEDAANELETGILDPVIERGHFYVSPPGV